MNSTDWITVPNWERFQHYKHRNPPWIKNYRALLHKPEYLHLPLPARGLLHGIWLAYAETDGQIQVGDIRDLLQTCGRLDADLKHLASLNHAGLVGFSASNLLAKTLCYSGSSLKQSVDQPRLEPDKPQPRQNAGAYRKPDQTVEEHLDYVTLETIKTYTASFRP